MRVIMILFIVKNFKWLWKNFALIFLIILEFISVRIYVSISFIWRQFVERFSRKAFLPTKGRTKAYTTTY